MSISPVDIFKYIDVGIISVFIRVEPAIIATAPNSPSALDQVITVADMIPVFRFGRIINLNASQLLHPRVRATNIIFSLLSFNEV